MASIRFGGGIVDARGSIAGNTFSRNASGGYQRARTAPTNPQTSRQSIVRDALSANAAAWRSLTDQQRQAWIDAATTQQGQYTNRLGEVQHYSGMQLFMVINMRREAYRIGGGGGSDSDTTEDPPPLTPGPGQLELSGTGTLEVDGSSFEVTTFDLDVESAAATNQLLIYASPPVSPGVMRPASVPFALIESLANATVAGIDLAASYTQAYGGIVQAGMSVFVKVKRISIVSWRQAAPVTVKLVAVQGA